MGVLKYAIGLFLSVFTFWPICVNQHQLKQKRFFGQIKNNAQSSFRSAKSELQVVPDYCSISG